MDYKTYYLNQLQTGGKLDYKKYYDNQLKGAGFPVFSGYHNQRGHGVLGAWLKRILWPSLKNMAIPILKQGGDAVKTELVKTAANIATDALAGKNIGESAKENFTSAVGNLAQKATQAITQKGSGYKKKRKAKHLSDYNNFTSVKKNILHHDPPRFKQRKLIDVFDTR
jgi:hypothetical protein